MQQLLGMGQNEDLNLIAQWKHQPAPLLGLMHAFHDRDGHISDEAIRSISEGLRIPLADLYSTVTFYHHFSRKLPGKKSPRICTGTICSLRGARDLLKRFDNAVEMPCAGRCDTPIPLILKDDVFTLSPSAQLLDQPSPVPLPNPGGIEECLFSKIRDPDRKTLEGYQNTNGYDALKEVWDMSPTDLIKIVEESGLAGRGGAGFPTGKKWEAVLLASGNPKSIVCNADEGEPGCFKDRALLDYDVHAVIEGMAIAAHATGAEIGFIYLRYEYPKTAKTIENALNEARQAGFLGRSGFDVHIRRGGGAYICGEEGSLLNSLEGKHPYPRNRPPFPVTHGFNQQPTVVNNVETLAAIAPIVRHGPDWYRGLGLGEHNGTKLISLSGDIQYPGNYEIPIGLSLPTLLNEWAGGPLKGRAIQAVTMAGLSGGFLAGEDLNVTLDDPALQSLGTFLGAGGIMVFDDRRDMIEVAREAMNFFADESCGKCFPCRIGTQRISERLGLNNVSIEPKSWLEEVQDLGAVMRSTSACGLGTAAPNVSDSLLKYFPEQIEAYLRVTADKEKET
ncbi:MAG: NADH-ubiquinone oxidoreductase-F iron-sulfur binding region domain-containing protein [Candidatus Latescibacterota bacterium]|nr:NADH-ubiquinone oxidoreductase-F iron-sulfur binding region domain-containing protein [Candidatus Latescibacterota bacterium]